MQVLQKVLKGSGVSVHDGGMVPGIQVMSASGAQTIVPDLEAVWGEVEKLRGHVIDPFEL
jgi:hypothetical protein